jgi:hypothetical protein
LILNSRCLAKEAFTRRIKQDVTITIHIYNFAQVEGEELSQAEQLATTILDKAGVKIVWSDCATSTAEASRFSFCNGSYDSTELFLEIQPWSTIKLLHLGEAMLGACPTCMDRENRSQALVSYHRVEVLAHQWHIERAQLLGAAAAHEIGHFLLRRTSHSSVGIMRAEFHDEDFQVCKDWHLRFTPEQTRIIRSEVLRRFRDRSR